MNKTEAKKKIEELRKKNKLFDMFSKTFSSEEKQEENIEAQQTTYLEIPHSRSANNQIQYFQITVLPTPLVVSASAMHLILLPCH